MIRYDETGGVWELFSDDEGTEWLGAYDSWGEACLALKAYRAGTFI